ncbi:MAG: hypothetical protein U9R25_09220 [Chloroflexota bacterium]|nr:hypothetical protein [Chloroflexota bacterium]
MRSLKVIWSSFRSLYDELFLMIGLSLLWWLAVVTIVAGPPATTALASIGYRLGNGQRVGLDHAKESFLGHFWLSWKLGLAGLVGMAVIFGNIFFYNSLDNWLRTLVILFLYLAIAWIAILLYVFPMPEAMETPGALDILRNAAIMALASPGFTFLILLGLAIVLAICLALPFLLLLIAPGIIAIISGTALADRIAVAEEKQNS